MSLVQKTAYIGGQNLYDEYCGVTHYQHRDDIVFKEIVLPQGAPQEYSNEQVFVTEIDRSEKRCNSQTAREVIFSLPIELSIDEQIELAHRCIDEFWVSRGMCAYMAIHDKGKGNPHVHVLLTTRNVDSSGFNAKKNRDWNKRELVFLWRKFLAAVLNQALERNSLDIKVSCESHFVQGIDETPTKYLGAKVKALEQKGIITDRVAKNREIREERERKAKKREQKLEAKKLQKRRRSYGRTR